MRLKDILNPKPIVESSLKVGSMIFVHGFPMLKGLLSSQYYKVTRIDGDDITFQRVNKQGDVTNFTSGTITHKLSSIEASIQNVGRADVNGVEIVDESIKESWTVKDGSVLSNGKLIGYYDFDRDSDSFWVDDVKKGKGQLSFDTKKEVEDYFKKNEKDAVKHLGKLRESTNPSDIIKDLDKVRTDLIKKVDLLIAKKKKLYSDVDITTPMSADEKQLDKDIQSIFSQIQQIIQQKRKIKNESVNEAKTYKKGDKLKIKLPNGKKFDVVFDMYSRTKGVALGKFKDGNGEYDIKPFNLDTVVESVNEETQMQTMIRKYADTKPESIYYVFYKGQFEATYAGTFGINTDYYWDKFKVRRAKGSQFKLNPEFIIVSKKTYDTNPNHYAKLKPYVDKFWDKLKNESVNEEKVYIDYLNKQKGFKQDRIKFNSYEEAVKWARKNFEKFNPDMIKYESVNEDWSKEYKDSIDCNNPKGFSQKAHCAGKKKNETMLRLKNLLGEAKFETYHNTYTSAINAAREYAEKQGYEINDDDSFTKIGMGPRKPSEGKTNRFSIEITKDGKPQRKMLHIQVYGMKNKYELNAYIG